MAQKHVIVYFCDPKCTSDIKHKKAQVKQPIYLVADGTDVELDFGKKSPFDPPVYKVQIAKDTFVKLKAGSTKGRYLCTISCAACKRKLDEPSMIIEL